MVSVSDFSSPRVPRTLFARGPAVTAASGSHRACRALGIGLDGVFLNLPWAPPRSQELRCPLSRKHDNFRYRDWAPGRLTGKTAFPEPAVCG